MEENKTIKLPLLSRRKRLPQLPGQLLGTSYGVIWNACEAPEEGSCYLAELRAPREARILAYIDARGHAFFTDRPLAQPPDRQPDFALEPTGEREGAVCVLDGEGTLRRVGAYKGTFSGALTELSDRSTWNVGRNLRYRDFMASMFLRYCMIDGNGPSAFGAPDAPRESQDADARSTDDAALAFLTEALARMPLADALSSLLFMLNDGLEEGQEPSRALERYERHLLEGINIDRLRAISVSTPLNVTFIERMGAYYVNFDRDVLSEKDVRLVFAAESAVNRLTHMDARASSEEACSQRDWGLFADVTSHVERLMEHAGDRNGWSTPGSRACAPGGEWDVRTRFISRVERLSLVTRLEYEFSCDAQAGEMAIAFIAPSPAELPQDRWNEERGGWEPLSADELAACTDEHAARMALVLAAACFASSPRMLVCYVEARSLDGNGLSTVRRFERDAFLARDSVTARKAVGSPLPELMCFGALLETVCTGEVPQIGPAGRTLMPRDDPRPLPDALRPLLMADRACELEVMEDDGDPSLARLAELEELAKTDTAAAAEGLTDLVESLLAACALAELSADRPVCTQFCDSHVARLLLPLHEADTSLRVLRAPDALFFAERDYVNLCVAAGAYEQALPSAQRALDMAPTSAQAHLLLVNVLAYLSRFDEVVDVVKHGLRVAFDRESIGYLFYRVAFAYWRLGDAQTARACYSLVPTAHPAHDAALEELRALGAQTGCGGALPFSQSSELARKAGLCVPPTRGVLDRAADLAVLLVDNGFFFLGARALHMVWSVVGGDELAALQRSLRR